MSYAISLLASFLAVVIVLTLHEFAHAFVAVKCGDPTPKWNGRLTLNPFKHFDLVGLICFAFVGFGWAKPVPINPNNFKKYRSGMALTASAGVITNFLTALLIYPLYFWVSYSLNDVLPYYVYQLLSTFLQLIYAYSLSFCVFNLLPFYPLDGFRVIDALNKRRGKVFQFLRRYGYYILLFLIVESFICDLFVRFGVWQMSYLDILGWVMTFATDILGWPIMALWGAIFRWPIPSIFMLW